MQKICPHSLQSWNQRNLKNTPWCLSMFMIWGCCADCPHRLEVPGKASHTASTNRAWSSGCFSDKGFFVISWNTGLQGPLSWLYLVCEMSSLVGYWAHMGLHPGQSLLSGESLSCRSQGHFWTEQAWTLVSPASISPHQSPQERARMSCETKSQSWLPWVSEGNRKLGSYEWYEHWVALGP